MTVFDLQRLRELAEKAEAGEFGSITTFAIAANPQTVLALLDEIETLRPQKWACEECGEVEAELKAKIERLEKEVDWLAWKLVKNGILSSPSSLAWEGKDEQANRVLNAYWQQLKWREAARKAVEANNA